MLKLICRRPVENCTSSGNAGMKSDGNTIPRIRWNDCQLIADRVNRLGDNSLTHEAVRNSRNGNRLFPQGLRLCEHLAIEIGLDRKVPRLGLPRGAGLL